MRRPPTIEEAERIELILREVTVRQKDEYFNWGGPNNGSDRGKEAKALCLAISGYKPDSSDCFSCRMKVLNILAESIGLPAFAHEVSEERKQRRLAVCVTCPAYHIKTESCGRLITDALSPKPVLIDGTEVNPCGCYLPLKTKFKHSQCPANKWH